MLHACHKRLQEIMSFLKILPRFAKCCKASTEVSWMAFWNSRYVKGLTLVVADGSRFGLPLSGVVAYPSCAKPHLLYHGYHYVTVPLLLQLHRHYESTTTSTAKTRNATTTVTTSDFCCTILAPLTSIRSHVLSPRPVALPLRSV